MKISCRWCADFLRTPPPFDGWQSRLTGVGLETESATPTAVVAGDVVAGRIVDCEKHPNADKLRVCRVDIGGGEKTIVCGAPNARAGITGAVATVGATIGDGKIKRRAIRGVESEGMLCSAAELGLGADAAGILEFGESDAVAPGEDLADKLSLNDRVLDIGITPNRGDCLSHLGVAREVAAAFGAGWQMPPAADNAAADIADVIPARLETPADCPYYGCLLIRDVDCARPSPWRLRTRLERCGGRAVNAVVDITNYLMLAFGQPLHAFDADKIAGGVCVRRAAAGERLRLLDGTTAECAAEDLLIADDNGGIALGGVMGGLESGVSPTTRNILLEAAFFDPAAVRGRARKFNLSSEAAFRFERGVDPTLPPIALAEAARLIKSVCGGRAGRPFFAGSPPAPNPPTVAVSFAKIDKILGGGVVKEIGADGVIDLLGRFSLPAKKTAAADAAAVDVPPWRFDIKKDVDLIEEIIRAWGYEKLPETMPAGGRLFSPSRAPTAAADAARAFFVGRGFFEAIAYSFVPAKWESALSPGGGLPLRNPLSEEMAVMRSTLWGGLLDRAAFNVRHRRDRVFLFEIGRCFLPPPAGENSPPAQPLMLGGIAVGAAAPASWGADGREADFFDIKGLLEAFLGDDGGQVDARPTTSPALHPGKGAELVYNGAPVGRLGELHPELFWSAEFKSPPLLFEINLDALPPAPAAQIAPVSRFPVVRRDLAFVVDAALPVGELIASARRAAPSPPVTDIRLFDFYAAEGHNSVGEKSCGLRLLMQGGAANLTGEEIDQIVGEVAGALRRERGAILRE